MKDQKKAAENLWRCLVMTIALSAISIYPISDTEAKAGNDGFQIRTLIDQPVLNPKGQEVGEIEDLIIRRNGKVKKAIISLGGVLGIADKDVTAPFRHIKIRDAEKIIYDKTIEELEDQPAFHNDRHGLYTDYFYQPYLPGVSGGPRGPYTPGYGPHQWEGNRDYPHYPYGGPYGRWYGHHRQGRAPEAFSGPYPDSMHPWARAHYPARMLASVILGRAVINKQGEEVASVNDLILGPDNDIESIILAVGGFLGIGAKLVAVPYKPIGFTLYGITYDISRESLENKPAVKF